MDSWMICQQITQNPVYGQLYKHFTNNNYETMFHVINLFNILMCPWYANITEFTSIVSSNLPFWRVLSREL